MTNELQFVMDPIFSLITTYFSFSTIVSFSKTSSIQFLIARPLIFTTSKLYSSFRIAEVFFIKTAPGISRWSLIQKSSTLALFAETSFTLNRFFSLRTPERQRWLISIKGSEPVLQGLQKMRRGVEEMSSRGKSDWMKEGTQVSRLHYDGNEYSCKSFWCFTVTFSGDASSYQGGGGVLKNPAGC